MDGPTRSVHELDTGQLILTVHDKARAGLFRIAERQNPKRAFLFVSTVLGRHIPVNPSDHRTAIEALADRVVSHVGAGPIFIMSYAETAIGLGLGVFDALEARLLGRSMGYLPTTRFQPAGLMPWFMTREEHSHAVDHMVFQPHFPESVVDERATLILIDDETTTGKTFLGLAEKLGQVGLRPANIVLVTLTDWSNGASVTLLRGVFPDAYIAHVSLLAGCYEWMPSDGVAPRSLPPACAAECPIWVPEVGERFGVPRTGIDVETHRVDRKAWGDFVDRDLVPTLAEAARVLIIGSGEHVWYPFLAAERIEAAGHKTGFIATTRSPVRQGTVILNQIVFADHYGLGIPMYLNNVRPEAWDEILLFTETGLAGVPGALRAFLAKGRIITPCGTWSMSGEPS